MLEPAQPKEPSRAFNRNEESLRMAREKFESDFENYKYWARYVTVSLPLLNVGGIAAILQYLNHKAFDPQTVGNVWLPLAWYAAGLGAIALTLCARIIESFKSRGASRDLMLDILKGEPELDLEVFRTGDWDRISFAGWILSAFFFTLASVRLLTELRLIAGS